MNRSVRLRIAHALARRLVRIMPKSRAEWTEGMKAEIETIEDPATALSFALGCVRAGYGRRMQSVPGVLAMVRWSVATVTVLFSVIVLANAGWWLVQTNAPALPSVLGLLGLAFLIAGLALARFGPVALASIAAGMLVLNTIGHYAASPTTAPVAEFHRALVIEGYLLWSALLMAGLTLLHAGRSARLAAFARDHGWDE